MDSDQLNRWLAIGANIGVLVGIGLLIVELDQNRDMMRAQTRHQIAVEATNYMLDTSNNGEMAEIIVKTLNDEELTQAESIRYRFRVFAWFRRAAADHYQYRLGLYDEDEFEAMRNSWRTYVNSNRQIAVTWCVFRDNVSQVFRNELEPLFESKPCQ